MRYFEIRYGRGDASMINRQTVARAFPVRPLGEIAEFLDHKRRPVKESERLPGPFLYYGANGQQGTIDAYLFDEPLILLAEDGGFFETPERGIAYRIVGPVTAKLCKMAI
jgi:type I restriction enzyme S subunit